MRRPTRNAILLFAGELVTRFLGFFVAALLARRLGLDGFGQVGFAVSIMSYGVIVTKFGLLTIGIRDAAQNPSSIPGLTANILSIRLLLGLASFAAITLFALFIDKPASVKLLLVLFAAGALFQTLLLEWVFNGLEMMEYPAGAHVLMNGVYFGLVAALVRGPAQVLIVPVAFSAGVAVAALFLILAYSRRFGLPRFGFDFIEWKTLAVRSWPVGLASVLSQFYVNSGIVGLALLRSDHEAGLLTAAHRLIFFLLTLDRVLQAVFLPVVSRCFKTSPERLPGVAGDALRVITALSLPVCIGLSLLSRPALALVYGVDYTAASTALAVLSWFLPASLLTTLAGYSLLASGRERRFLVNTAIGVAVATAMLIPGIIRYGLVAAAVALVAGELVMLALMGRDALRLFRPKLDVRFAAPVLSSAMLAVVLLLLRNWNWPVAAVVGALTYSAIMFVARGLTLKDLGLVKQ